jgi:hypothetical protein
MYLTEGAQEGAAVTTTLVITFTKQENSVLNHQNGNI